MQLLEEYNQKKPADNSELVKLAMAKIEEVVSAIFDAIPAAVVITVEGFTPHFNDGDICHFRMDSAVNLVGIQNLYHTALYNIVEDDFCYKDDQEFDEAKDLNEDLAKIVGNLDLKSALELFDTQEKSTDFNNAIKLMDHLSDEFELLDDDNGTAWTFSRTEGNNFRMHTEVFDHD